ncbi:hypothetical protein D5086_029403 [Populus alba]|uniref:Uncharacterized protein n=1 Tax=Populus alba TaxID=43335 RepID=A0ACC4ATH4_POPAL
MFGRKPESGAPSPAPLKGVTKSANTTCRLGEEKAEEQSCWTGKRLRDKALAARGADLWRGRCRLKLP